MLTESEYSIRQRRMIADSLRINLNDIFHLSQLNDHIQVIFRRSYRYCVCLIPLSAIEIKQQLPQKTGSYRLTRNGRMTQHHLIVEPDTIRLYDATGESLMYILDLYQGQLWRGFGQDERLGKQELQSWVFEYMPLPSESTVRHWLRSKGKAVRAA